MKGKILSITLLLTFFIALIVPRFGYAQVVSPSASSTAPIVNVDPGVVNYFASSSAPLHVIIELNASSSSVLSVGRFSNAHLQQLKNIRTSLIAGLPSGAAGRLNKNLDIISGVAGIITPADFAILKNDPLVKSIQVDQVAHVFDVGSSNQIKATQMWTLPDGNNNSLTGIGERIAVIDTGVDYMHSDLGGCFGPNCKVIGGYDFVNNDTNPMDDNGHGTHVASLAAGRGNASNGVVLNGVAPDAKILAYKVCDASGDCLFSNIIKALQLAADPNNLGTTSDHVNVAVLSLGGSGNPDDVLSQAVDAATAAGIVVVVAAGNDGPASDTINSPGTARTAITVAASCEPSQVGFNSYCSSSIASFSSQGPLIWNGTNLSKPDISAPGVDICGAKLPGSFPGDSTCYDSKHISLSGTSMAAAVAAGAALLTVQEYPNDTPAQIKQLLISSATSLGLSPNAQGAGEINLAAAFPSATSSIIVSSSTWAVVTNPLTQYSTSTEQFFATSTSLSTSSISVSININSAGVTATSSATTLNVSAGGVVDPFSVSLTVDNNVATSGPHVGSIVLTQNGVTQGIIPLLLTVTPTLSVNSSVLNYGLDDTLFPSWTSPQIIIITNLRNDATQTVSVTAPVFPNGITFNASSSIIVPASSSQSLNTSLVANNQSLGSSTYDSVMFLGNSINSLSLETQFTDSSFVQEPTLATSTPTSITQTGVILNASLTADGGASSTVEGFNWGISPAYGTTTVATGTFGVGSFSTTVSGLACATTYHWRAYAANSAGTTTTPDSSFVTSSCTVPSVVIATLATSTPTSITETGATLNALLTADGGASSTIEGFTWGTSSTYTATTTATGTFGVGAFSTTLSSLVCATTYHWSAYSVNSVGTSTTPDASFMTSSCPAAVVSSGGGGGGGGGGGSSYVPPIVLASTTVPVANTASSTSKCPTGYACINSTVLPQQKNVTTPVVGAFVFTRNLQIGSTGADVTALQSLLVSLGFFNLTPTGYYGALTAAAVEAYQIANGIPGVATVGPMTRASLNSKESSVPATATQVNISSPISSSATTTTILFSLGSSGSEVRDLQVYLNDHGYTIAPTGPGSSGNETDYFGSRTEHALISFQSANALAPSGELDAATLNFISQNP